VLNLEDNLTQLQLTQGAMNIRVRHLDPEQVVEVDTPNIALTLKQPGNYRVVVDTDGNATDVIVRSGRAEVYGDGASYVVDSRQSYRFYDTTLTDYEVFARRGSTTSIAGRRTAIAATTRRSRHGMCRRTSSATRISTRTGRGARIPITGTSGTRRG
jgi:hypothetical protein